MHGEAAPQHLELWRRDSETLRELVARWRESSDLVQVMIPRAQAKAAVESWERTEPTSDLNDHATTQESNVRAAAAVIGLIGSAVSSRGEWGESYVSVELPLSVLCEAAALHRDPMVP